MKQPNMQDPVARDNRKNWPKFVAVLIVALFAGGALGTAVTWIMENPSRDEIIRQAFAKPEKAPQKPHVDTFSKRFMGGFDQYKNKPNANANTYQVGDVVVHQTFGKGRVVSVRAMGNDHLLEIVFDTAGQKKIMANFAKLEKA